MARRNHKITLDDILTLCRSYAVDYMFGKSDTALRQSTLKLYEQILSGEYKPYKDESKVNLNIKPVHGAWSRNAQVEKNAYAKDILQPFQKDGTINKHFVEAHGTRSLQKELKMSDKAIRANAEKYG